MLNPMPKTFDYWPPTDPWLDILHEDADIVVFNKPSGLLSVPGKDPALFDSLQSRALERVAGAGTTGAAGAGAAGGCWTLALAGASSVPATIGASSKTEER